jgi:hypothetical protein
MNSPDIPGRIRLSRPGMSGDSLLRELSGGLARMVSVVRGIQLGGWDVAAVFIEASVVEPVGPRGDMAPDDGLSAVVNDRTRHTPKWANPRR